MGYQALLFCPDDKTARTVTQVLSELEFTVEACIEPFAAVKKLMGQHFDAVVVDCDNEQNATLLFKSARNSTSNQTSLAVAVVEGQAGVAKAFRIGANLVLTKPINIEQAKGTLRVARGLLRKSDPTKPGTATGTFAVPTASGVAATPATPNSPTATAATPTPVKSAAPKPTVAAKPPAPVAPKPVTLAATATYKPPQAPAKPATPAAWPSAAAQTNTVHGAPVAEKPAPPAPPAATAPLYNATLATPVPQRPIAPPAEIKPSVASAPAVSGAASAPAPALEPQVPKVEPKPADSAAAEALFERPVESAPSETPAYVGAAPSFSFGGSTAESEPGGGGSKKIFIGIAAAAVVVVGGYFGYSHFKGSASSAPQTVAVASPSAPSTAPNHTAAAPASPSVDAAKPSASQPNITLKTASNPSDEDSESSTSAPNSRSSASAAKPAYISSAPAKSTVNEDADVEAEPVKPALVVKGGKEPSLAKSAAADAPAPSVIGMGGALPEPALPNLGSSSTSVKPMLQTLSVSQGVSQGLLYKKVAPSYPPNALRMHVEGTVELQATISKTGDITKIKVLSGDPQLTKAASDAVKQWKYKPYLLNGEPVEIQTGVTVNFKLPH